MTSLGLTPFRLEKTIWAAVVTAVCALATPELAADVFSLWPRGGAAPRAGGGGLTTALGALTARREPVVVNGVKSELVVKISQSDFLTCVKKLRSLYPNATISFNGNGLLMQSLLPDGDRQRIYLVAMDGAPYPIVQFSMRLPKQIPDSYEWDHTDLPALPHAALNTFMRFPDRDASYGVFTVMAPPNQSFAEIQTKLNVDGWRSFTEGAMSPWEQRGGVFIRENPLAVCVVQMNETPSGVVKGAVYARPLSE